MPGQHVDAVDFTMHPLNGLLYATSALRRRELTGRFLTDLDALAAVWLQ